MSENKFNIGIDFGNYSGKIAYYNKATNQIEIVKFNLSGDNKDEIKYSISFDKNGKNIIGAQNINFIQFHPKDFIGKRLNEIPEKLQLQNQYNIHEDEKGLIFEIPIGEETEQLRIEEICAIFIDKMINQLLQKFRLPMEMIGNVSITVPTYFNENQKAIIERASKLAGIKDIKLINEPQAIFLGYQKYLENNHSRDSIHEGDKICIVDIGYSLDVAICEYRKHSLKIISSDHHDDVGGKHFDDVMVELIKSSFEENYEISFSPPKDPKKMKQWKQKMFKLKEVAERAKIELTTQLEFEIDLNQIDKDNYDYDDYVITISREKFEEKSNDLMNRFANHIKQIITKSGIKPENFQHVILTGKTSNIPKIRKIMRKIFGDVFNDYSHEYENRLLSVKGACLHSCSIHNEIKELKYYDIIPFYIGIRLPFGKFLVLFEQNSQLPIEKTINKYHWNTFNSQSTKIQIIKYLPKQNEKINKENNKFPIIAIKSKLVETIKEITLSGLQQVNQIELSITGKLDKNGRLNIIVSTIQNDKIIEQTVEYKFDLSTDSLLNSHYEEIKQHYDNFMKTHK